MLTAEEYLRARGWCEYEAMDTDSVIWLDPLGSVLKDADLMAETAAIEVQVQRDRDCAEFVAGYAGCAEDGDHTWSQAEPKCVYCGAVMAGHEG